MSEKSLLNLKSVADADALWWRSSLAVCSELVRNRDPNLTTPSAPLRTANRMALAVMEQWLTRIKTDKSSDSAKAKVLKNKPAAAVDACFDAAMNQVAEPMTYQGPGQLGIPLPVGIP